MSKHSCLKVKTRITELFGDLTDSLVSGVNDFDSIFGNQSEIVYIILSDYRGRTECKLHEGVYQIRQSTYNQCRPLINYSKGPDSTEETIPLRSIECELFLFRYTQSIESVV